MKDKEQDLLMMDIIAVMSQSAAQLLRAQLEGSESPKTVRTMYRDYWIAFNALEYGIFPCWARDICTEILPDLSDGRSIEITLKDYNKALTFWSDWGLKIPKAMFRGFEEYSKWLKDEPSW